MAFVHFTSCMSNRNTPVANNFSYQRFKDSLLQTDTGKKPDTSNLFDNGMYVPGEDSLQTLLRNIDTLWKSEMHLMAHLDSMKKNIGKEAGFSADDKAIIQANIKEVDSFLMARDTIIPGGCAARECIVFAEIDKSKQLLYLYILGEIKDTFKVSTGKGKKYETPGMELHPLGPVLTKYTSRKFPGGNYQGLGNMPYAVFLKNGYAIHGTTPGNYSKLGSRASHGCIRLHPDNAKVFNALIKTVGLQQTWISVKDSIP